VLVLIILWRTQWKWMHIITFIFDMIKRHVSLIDWHLNRHLPKRCSAFLWFFDWSMFLLLHQVTDLNAVLFNLTAAFTSFLTIFWVNLDLYVQLVRKLFDIERSTCDPGLRLGRTLSLFLLRVALYISEALQKVRPALVILILTVRFTWSSIIMRLFALFLIDRITGELTILALWILGVNLAISNIT